MVAERLCWLHQRRNLPIIPRRSQRREYRRTSDLQYMMKYIYRFNQPRLLQVNDIINSAKDIGLYESVCNKNILVVDDVTTSDSTLNELLRTLRIYNKENEITIFSLNSRKEFMVDKKLETKIKEIWFDADFLYGRDDAEL